MIQSNEWMETLTDKLKHAFGNRLLFVGLQGSYQRGEATETSDIDAVVILDTLSLDDLKQYKAILCEMPEHEKACGFVSGKQELQHWPKQELFQFASDTQTCYGTLDGLLPPIERKDIIEGMRVGASGLYHTCCHAYLHGEPEALKGLYKAAFFVLQSVVYLQHGRYAKNKKELLPLLEGIEQDILLTGMNWRDSKEKILANPDPYFESMRCWCSAALTQSF